jgi:hypothetical protein
MASKAWRAGPADHPVAEVLVFRRNAHASSLAKDPSNKNSRPHLMPGTPSPGACGTGLHSDVICIAGKDRRHMISSQFRAAQLRRAASTRCQLAATHRSSTARGSSSDLPRSVSS